MPSNMDAVAKAAEMCGLEKDAVSGRLEKMQVNQVLDLLDAVAAGDESRTKELLGAGAKKEGEEQSDADADEFEISPLFMKGDSGPGKKVDDENIEEEDHDPNMGDEVRVDGEDATVKVLHGPRDTIGVQMDGNTVMVNKDQVKRVKKIEEGVVGMGPVSNLRRIQELAGLPPSAEMARESNPLAPGRVGEPMPAEEPEMDAGEAEVEYFSPERIATLAGAMPEIGGAPEMDCPMAGADLRAAAPAPAAPVSISPEVEVEVETEATPLALDDILTAFDMIEDGLPEIKLGDAKEVRARLNDLIAKLNESLDGRKRKL